MKDDPPLGAGRRRLVVGDEDDSAPLGMNGGEQFEDLDAGGGVELAGRFVGQQQLGVVDQRPGQRHPLLLAAGELVGAEMEAVAEPDLGQQLLRRARAAPGRGSARRGREG